MESAPYQPRSKLASCHHSVSLETRLEETMSDIEFETKSALDIDSGQDDDEDHEMTIEDAGLEGDGADSLKVEPKEVKLDDLFADVESDEEFSSWNAEDVKSSSSPEAPASPL